MSLTSNELSPPPEAELIRIARLARGLSPEAAADQTPIRLGGARWRHIERGYEPKRPPRPVKAPDKTLAHMAHTVGVSPERLDEVGRGGAAEILREIRRREVESTANPEPMTSRELQILADIVTSTAEKLDLSDEDLEEAFRRARASLERKRATGDQRAEPPERPSRHRAG